MVDGLARQRLQQTCSSCSSSSSSSSSSRRARDARIIAGYKGLNLQSKAKTPGDAWGGAEDGDKEEATVIIQYASSNKQQQTANSNSNSGRSLHSHVNRNGLCMQVTQSELLQGVFDKNQFGSSSGGLLHCVYLLLGSKASSMLLQALAALFCCFLKLHGATTSPADFVLRREGLQQRQALIDRVVAAGTFLQEHFVSRLSTLLNCPGGAANKQLQQRLAAAKAAARASPPAFAAAAAAAAAAGEEGGEKTRAAAVAAAAAAFDTHGREAGLQRRQRALVQMAAAAAAAAAAADDGGGGAASAAAATAATAEATADTAAAGAAVLQEKLNLARLADAAADLLSTQQHQQQQQQQRRQGKKRQQQQQQQEAGEGELNPWLLLRQSCLPLAAAGVRPTAAAAAKQLREMLRLLQRMQDMPEQRRLLLLLLSSSPLLQQQLPRVAKVLQTQRLLPLYAHPSSSSSSKSSSSSNSSSSSSSSMNAGIPTPNVVGNCRFLRPKLFYPSWLWNERQNSDAASAAFAANEFGSTARYVAKAAASAAAASATKQIAFLCPSIITQVRKKTQGTTNP
ncbi:hypothetical protein ACSSS7_002942 [Eimeria intestinalis]